MPETNAEALNEAADTAQAIEGETGLLEEPVEVIEEIAETVIDAGTGNEAGAVEEGVKAAGIAEDLED